MRRTVIALLLLMSGAAVAQPAKQNPWTQTPQKGHCDIGVVSHLGEKFRVNEKGFLGDKVSEVPVKSWHLDDLVVDRIRGAFGKRAVVQRITYRKEALEPFERPKPFRFLYWDAAIHTLAPGTRCASYVLVTEDMFSDWNGPTVIGVGIAKYPFGGFEIHTIIKVWVVDGETFKLLNYQTAHTAKSIIPYPERTVDAAFWPDPPNSAAQNAKLREAVRELLAQSLDATLPGLRLTP